LSAEKPEEKKQRKSFTRKILSDSVASMGKGMTPRPSMTEENVKVLSGQTVDAEQSVESPKKLGNPATKIVVTQYGWDNDEKPPSGNQKAFSNPKGRRSQSKLAVDFSDIELAHIKNLASLHSTDSPCNVTDDASPPSEHRQNQEKTKQANLQHEILLEKERQNEIRATREANLKTEIAKQKEQSLEISKQRETLRTKELEIEAQRKTLLQSEVDYEKQKSLLKTDTIDAALSPAQPIPPQELVPTEQSHQSTPKNSLTNDYNQSDSVNIFFIKKFPG
jgi:hypothetical protein